jgi:hypothetical protein
MKQVVTLILMLAINLPGQAMVMKPGTPRPIEGARLKILTDQSQSIESIFMTKFSLEQTTESGLTLNIRYATGARAELVYKIQNIDLGSCGEKVVVAMSMDTEASNYYVRLIDQRANSCSASAFIAVPNWKMELKSLDTDETLLVGIGNPEPIFTALSQSKLSVSTEIFE